MGKTIKFHSFIEFNKKAVFLLASAFLLVNLILQFHFFNYFFLNPNGNGDETGYVYVVSNLKSFDLLHISSLNAQPFAFVCFFFNQIFDNPKFTIRFVSLISSLLSFTFVINYYQKNKFCKLVGDNKFINNLVLFSLFFGIFFIASNHFVGSSDAFSVALAVPGFILLTENLLNNKRHHFLLIGLLFALSFTSRPTFIFVLVAYLISFAVFFPKQIFSRKLILVGLSFVFFTSLINFSPLLNSGKLILDVKEIPKELGTSWFEMNYLMAKKWDAGEIPNTQWLSAYDVIAFKKQNPDFVFPKNHLDILKNDTGLFFRQMARMFILAMYSSFRYMYFLFPFLLFYAFFKKKRENHLELKKAYFTVSFYFISLLLFMVYAFKLMEFRWMNILLVFYTFYAIDFSKGISKEKRIVLFNSVFVVGILFFILKMLK